MALHHGTATGFSWVQLQLGFLWCLNSNVFIEVFLTGVHELVDSPQDDIMFKMPFGTGCDYWWIALLSRKLASVAEVALAFSKYWQGPDLQKLQIIDMNQWVHRSWARFPRYHQPTQPRNSSISHHPRAMLAFVTYPWPKVNIRRLRFES